ncbi:SET domain-containing protein [Agrocybe pediades]|nr:SET domain-containing protein [Agrocybe pediades]
MVDPVPQTDTDEAELSFEADDRPSSRVSTHSSTSDSWLTTEQEAARNTSSPASRETTPEERTVGQPPSQKTYGGFAALTWKEYSRHPENISLNPRYTKDLRPGLVDHVVEMTKVAETLITMPGMRTLYEAMILENTMNDEPEAPPIKIQNDVDDCAAPPWEFFYTNEMWHGEDVPAPEVKDLVGCSCKGACNPKSKSCTCLKRQAAVTGEMDFIYDKNGKLKRPGFPIYECNALCGCGDDCRNRVIQKGRKAHVHLRKTQYKGWGVFAGKRIPTGTFLGIYSGELISAKEAQRRGIAYNKFGRTYLFDLDFHHLRPQGPEADKWKPESTVDAFKAGNFTRFLNHSCDPNTRLFPCYINEPEPRPLLAVFTTKDIDVNEEICFSYSGDYPEDEEDPEKTSADPVKLAAKADKKDKIYEECRCGAVNCKGYMFMYDSAAEDDDEDDDDDSDSET